MCLSQVSQKVGPDQSCLSINSSCSCIHFRRIFQIGCLSTVLVFIVEMVFIFRSDSIDFVNAVVDHGPYASCRCPYCCAQQFQEADVSKFKMIIPCSLCHGLLNCLQWKVCLLHMLYQYVYINLASKVNRKAQYDRSVTDLSQLSRRLTSLIQVETKLVSF